MADKSNREHEHPGGDKPHRHSENDEMAVHDTTGRGRLEGEQTLQLKEEELIARKEQREVGSVRVGTDVVTEHRSIDVPVTREEVVIDRRPVNREAADEPISTTGRRVEVPVREEQVDVQKRAVVTEEVNVGKRVTQETKRVEGDVRREVVGVEHDDDVRVQHSGAGIPHWDEVKSQFRSKWQGTGGRTWEQDEPAYRYGWESGHDQRYQGREWNDVETDLNRDWSSRHGKHGTWDQVRSNTRQAWDQARTRSRA